MLEGSLKKVNIQLLQIVNILLLVRVESEENGLFVETEMYFAAINESDQKVGFLWFTDLNKIQPLGRLNPTEGKMPN